MWSTVPCQSCPFAVYYKQDSTRLKTSGISSQTSFWNFVLNQVPTSSLFLLNIYLDLKYKCSFQIQNAFTLLKHALKMVYFHSNLFIVIKWLDLIHSAQYYRSLSKIICALSIKITSFVIIFLPLEGQDDITKVWVSNIVYIATQTKSHVKVMFP